MTRVIPAIAAAILVLTGVVHGLRTDRWGVSEERRTMAERVPTIPVRIGDWTSENEPLDDRHLRIAEADAGLSRRYRRTVPGRGTAEVVLILLCGRAAPLSAHTPDVCFANAGYRMDGEPQQFIPPDESDSSFWQARFDPPTSGAPQRVYWAWGDGRRWFAARDPRTEFAGRRSLYKMYLVCSLPSSPNSGDDDPAHQLLGALLPALHRSLAQP